MEQPNIKINKKTYWQAACKTCNKADRYKVYYDGKKSFVVRCQCGGTTELDNAKLQKKPDGSQHLRGW